MELGKIIGDKYRAIQVLGQGGTSVVYLAENIFLNNLWAIKTLSKKSPWFSYEMQEITVLKNLNHPMLPRIVDLIEDTFSYYIVMDYITGTNLLEYLRQNGRIQEKVLLEWTKDILGVLNYLHGRTPSVIYRDLKPANLMIDEDGRIRLVDFGTARFYDQGSKEDTLYIGTQGYAAPEQYGSGKSDERTDLFNLGMTLIHLATGIHPAKCDNTSIGPALKKSGLSGRFIKLILELIAADPDKRPVNCDNALIKLGKTTLPKNSFHIDSPKFHKGEMKCVVAISSMLPGSGTTSFCVALGSVFSKRGFHTALAELNPSGDFNRLKEMAEQMGYIKNDGGACFEIEDLTLFPSVQESSLIPRKRFDMVILDLGVLKNERGVRELNRSDVKLVLCPASLWKFLLIPVFFEGMKSYRHEEWIYAAMTSEKYQHQILNRQFDLEPLVVFPSIQDPFNTSREEEKSILNAMEQVFRHTGLRAGLKSGR